MRMSCLISTDIQKIPKRSAGLAIFCRRFGIPVYANPLTAETLRRGVLADCPESLDGILITHEHSDHISEVEPVHDRWRLFGKGH
jgi:ribonuclease BN (tRNA processing enzyme)